MTETNERNDDPRFTFGLLSDLWEVLRQHGYRVPADKEANNRALGHAVEDVHRLVRAYEGATDEHERTLV